MQSIGVNLQTNAEVEIVDRYERDISYYMIKRTIDIIGSLCGIILLCPVMLITAIAIKMDSKGSIIFAHKRLGHNGRIIKVYKFRTMVTNAQELLEKLTPEQKKEFQKNFKLENDPRITHIGNFLRKSSIDELPQLFNILIGNMTIVGPRPIVPKEIAKYGQYDSKFLSVKPGLTGLWQVSGRSNTTYEERVQLDMKYIDNRSILGDIAIILKTFGVVFKKVGSR